MKLEGKVGDQLYGDGTENPLRQEKTGALIVADGHSKYQEATLRRAMYSGSVVGQVTTVGLNTTYTGLCLSNPVGSPVDLVINKVGFSFIVAFAAGSHVGLMTGFNGGTNVTHTTPVTPRCQYFTGGGGGYGLLDSSATLPTAPTVNMIMGSGLTGAITTVPLTNGNLDVDGSIVLPPGAYCAIYTSTASGAAGGAFSFTWEEVQRQS